MSFNIIPVWLENAYSRPLLGVLGASDALMQKLPCLSFMLSLLAYYCTHYAISDRRYLNLLASRFFGLLWGLLYVNAEAGTRQTSRYIHPRSNHPCVYTQILVPRSFNQTPLDCRSKATSPVEALTTSLLLENTLGP